MDRIAHAQAVSEGTSLRLQAPGSRMLDGVVFSQVSSDPYSQPYTPLLLNEDVDGKLSFLCDTDGPHPLPNANNFTPPPSSNTVFASFQRCTLYSSGCMRR